MGDPEMKMKFVSISHRQVAMDISTRGDQPYERQFNSSFHPYGHDPNASVPTEDPYNFSHWLPLIRRNRGLKRSDCPVVYFDPLRTKLLLDAANGSIPAGRISVLYREEIYEQILPNLKELQFPPEGLFMRLDACSPKDGVQATPGKLSLHSAEEVVLRLVTSVRARNALEDAVEGGRGVSLFFLPFNQRIYPAREYRVFCPPPIQVGSIKISAISQYEWHSRWLFAETPCDTAREIVEEITRMCYEILEAIKVEMYNSHTAGNVLLNQGLTFDVFFDEQTNVCQLIEFNIFGIRSACGSCLFQWRTDKEVLYGQREMEFRVTY